jgi:hypothetical protein
MTFRQVVMGDRPTAPLDGRDQAAALRLVNQE